jgi:hypothetical protein
LQVAFLRLFELAWQGKQQVIVRARRLRTHQRSHHQKNHQSIEMRWSDRQLALVALDLSFATQQQADLLQRKEPGCKF